MSSTVLGSGRSPENSAMGSFYLGAGTPPAMECGEWIFDFMKPHSKLPFDGLLFLVSHAL